MKRPFIHFFHFLSFFFTHAPDQFFILFVIPIILSMITQNNFGHFISNDETNHNVATISYSGCAASLAAAAAAAEW